MSKFVLATLAVAAISLPSIARAESTPGAPTAQMQRVHQNMMQLHRQARSSMLAALTPAHRALLSQIAGRLATDPNADIDSAARTLDAALSPAESQAILRIAQNTHAQARQLMQQAFGQMRKREAVPTGGRPPEGRKTDAGSILLRMSMPHPSMEHRM